jgi:hypothetical protein
MPVKIVLASENHVGILPKIGVYAMEMGEPAMEFLNFEALQHAKK